MVARTRSSLSRSLLKDQAYAEIKRRIQDETFGAGGFLSERQLAEWLGMSKTPVKAALERLEQEGFLLVSPQQGIVVRTLTLQEIADQFELRLALESFVVQAIAGQVGTSQGKRIEKNLQQQQAAAKAASVPRMVRLDADFHLLLCETLGNQAIVECLAQHREQMHRVIRQVMSRERGRLTEAFQEHKSIYREIKRGRAASAVSALEKHLQFGQRALLSSNPPVEPSKVSS